MSCFSSASSFKGRKSSLSLFGLEVLSYIEAANTGKLADVNTIEDNKYIYVDNDSTTQASPYNLLLKSARFGSKGRFKQKDRLVNNEDSTHFGVILAIVACVIDY